MNGWISVMIATFICVSFYKLSSSSSNLLLSC
uniref:Uncharacterized protein n=1 Tax=Rhizophora mucronata TaxID=61149 RepID=A0A2P2P6B3_RHIMU